MVVDTKTRREITKKEKLFDETKRKAIERITNYVKVAINNLRTAERELLDEVEIEFGENPFSGLIDDDKRTEDEIKSILTQDIPSDSGPDDESFYSLCREIASFKSCQKKRKSHASDLIPQNVRCRNITHNEITLLWEDVKCECFYEVEVKSLPTMDNIYRTSETKLTLYDLEPDTTYYIRVRTVETQNNGESMWSNPVTVKTDPKYECIWKGCPEDVKEGRKYSVDICDFGIATNVSENSCTVISNTLLPHNKTTSWNIRILKSKMNIERCIHIGVAPFDIDQNEEDNRYKCGWYYNCWESTLYSGPPHNYFKVEYGPLEDGKELVGTGDTIGVIMDTAKGKLSFVLNGINLGVAFKGIPLDKPLVPCVILGEKGDSVELDFSEVKETVDSFIPVPSNAITKSFTWDSITLTWDAVNGAEFYLVETDENKLYDLSSANIFTKTGFFAETEHSFRVRAVKGSSVSEWSTVAQGKTIKTPDFKTCIWKECPEDVYTKRKYSVNEDNPRIATNICDDDDDDTDSDDNNYDNYCTIIGNTHIPLNKVTSFNIKILSSNDNDGKEFYIGVAPFDMNQNSDNSINYGWYFGCYCSALFSGPPHNYDDKEYGPRKEDGKYVHAGDTVGVVMDTIKGELSFILKTKNLGVAYEGIPLDKPLVPCVLLTFVGDSVKLTIK